MSGWGITSEPVEEEELSNLAVGFTVRMRKRDASPEGEATSSSGGKRSRWSPPDDGA